MVREEEEFNEEWWKVFKSLRGHLDDVYDLSWSRNGQHIVSGKNDSFHFHIRILPSFLLVFVFALLLYAFLHY